MSSWTWSAAVSAGRSDADGTDRRQCGRRADGVGTAAGSLCRLGGGQAGKSRKEDKALTEGVKSLLRGQIIDLGLHYIRETEIPPYGLDNLENYYTAYVDLGDGDRSTHDIMERCRHLPIRGGGT